MHAKQIKFTELVITNFTVEWVFMIEVLKVIPCEVQTTGMQKQSTSFHWTLLSDLPVSIVVSVPTHLPEYH